MNYTLKYIPADAIRSFFADYTYLIKQANATVVGYVTARFEKVREYMSFRKKSSSGKT